MSETEISKQCQDALKIAFPSPRAWWARNNVAGKRGRINSVGLGKGSADIVGCVRLDIGGGVSIGLMCAVEVKVPGKHPELDQLAWKKKHEEAGGIYVVAHSAQEAIDGVREAIEWKMRLAA